MQCLPTYVLVSPVRDEGEHIARTIRAVIQQTHRPLEWIIVDDGSGDETPEIVESFAREHSWIKLVRSENNHRRARGAPIVAAFNVGYGQLTTAPEVVVKLDGDLFLPAHYFEWVCAAFARDPRVGVAGGFGLVYDGDRWIRDNIASHTVVGYAKAYRVSCLDEIGGLELSMGWDGIDEYSARARGWKVAVFSELPILHYKRRGSRQRWWHARWEEGLANAYMGYRPSFLLLRVAYRSVVDSPPIVGGLTIGLGWLYARVLRIRTTDDEMAISELQAEQAKRMRPFSKARPAEPDSSPDGPAFWAG